MDTPASPRASMLETISKESLNQVWNGETSSLTKHEQAAHIEAVKTILTTNLSAGRLQYAIGKSRDAVEISDSDLKEYGLRVAQHYWDEHERLAALQRGEKRQWKELWEKLRRRAERMLHKKTNLSHSQCCERAQDHAQEACQRIAHSHYPCDVPFDAWANRILINCILKQRHRSPDLLDRGTFIEPDVESPLVELLVEYTFRDYNPFEHLEWRLLLLDTIARLPTEAQRQVIILGFFRDWEDAEIADALDRSRQAVHNLRHRALNNLREDLAREKVIRY